METLTLSEIFELARRYYGSPFPQAMTISDKKYIVRCEEICFISSYNTESRIKNVTIYNDQYNITCSYAAYDEIKILDTNTGKYIIDTEPTDITLQSILAKPQVKSARK